MVPFAGFWAWRWWYYGDLFPNTFYLKSGTSRTFFERGAWYAWDFFRVYWVWLALGMLASVWRERTQRYQPALFGVFLVTVWFAYVVAGGGDWMPYFRFFIPIVPLLYVFILHGLVDVAELLERLVQLPRGVLAAVVIAGASLVVVSSVRPFESGAAQDPSGFGTDPFPGTVDERIHREIGLWFKENIPPDYTVAEIATGIVPYYSDLNTLDMLGVNDHHIAHRDVPVGKGPAGHDKQDGAYVLLAHPQVIWLALGLEPLPRSEPEDYAPPKDDRWAPVVTDVTHNAYVWVFYRPVAIQLEDGWLNLLVRIDAAAPALALRE